MTNILSIVSSNAFGGYPDLSTMLDPRIIAIIGIATSVLIWLVGHVFMAIALIVMAEKRNLKKIKWLAILPFVNYFVLGKVIGESVIWGKKFKNVGLITMIFAIVSAIINFALNFAYGGIDQVTGEFVLLGGYLGDFCVI
ncbi:MAG: hypothetical protein J6V66_03145, partial [Clostridia bacterium]|nr:hypothetical protein [Clostridia bacterium]